MVYHWYNNTPTVLYEEAKKSLKKFKGDSQSGSSSAAVKLKPTFLAENEEAVLASGYGKGKRSRQRRDREALEAAERKIRGLGTFMWTV